MSALLAVAQAVPQAAPVVVQHPIIQTVTKYVVTHEVELSQFALYIGTGVGGSIVYSFIKRDGWSSTVNNIIMIVYAAIIGTLDLYVNHGGLNFANLLVAYLAVYGSTQTWYNTLFVLAKAESPSTPAATLPVASNP
jgi:hypothetical protein